jgi:NAD(P)-dependent dehydrogenase (short-subunit alcohol dehydrogenase family)
MSHPMRGVRRGYRGPGKSEADPFRLDDRTALITGGGDGVGLGVARAMVAAGARVVLAGRREEVVREAAAELGGEAVGIALDLTDLAALPEAVAAAVAAAGPIDILVNNAGNHERAPALEHDDAAFAAVLNVHLRGAFALTREVARGMAARDAGGAVVFVSSVNARIGLPEAPGYAAAKAGLIGLTGALATEWAPHGVRVNTIVSGWVDAGMSQRVFDADPERGERVLRRIPMARFGTAEDIGRAAVFLSSPAAAYVTGAALPVDGGALVAL